jgi:hypothetical protein
MSIINLLLLQNTYPVRLASEIGLINSVVVSEMIKKSEFNYIDDMIISASCRAVGISKVSNILNELSNIGICERDTKNKSSRVSIKWLEEFESDEIEVDVKEASVFRDEEFKRLFKSWCSVLKAKGFTVREKDLLSRFEGKEIHESLKALEYSINNKFTTLYFNEKNKARNGFGAKENNGENRGASQGNINSPRHWSNGGSGKNDEGSRNRAGEERASVRKGHRSLEDEEI